MNLIGIVAIASVLQIDHAGLLPSATFALIVELFKHLVGATILCIYLLQLLLLLPQYCLDLLCPWSEEACASIWLACRGLRRCSSCWPITGGTSSTCTVLFTTA